MDFTYTETQDMLRDMLARFLADTYDFDTRRAMISGDAGRDPGVWRALATELGILSAPLRRGSWSAWAAARLENAIIMEELGKAIAIEPYLQTVVIGGARSKLRAARWRRRPSPRSSAARQSSPLPMPNRR
ncbi:MAG: hypothetical protein HC788_07710, partial [Sphingopyxis sp.]|nr:hypothetical protein [Sphingopyxis sp.]